MASKLKIKVNGLVHNVTASLDTPLLYVLHNELHLHGPRFGCGLAQCGACSVLLDGKEIRSCVTPVAAVSGKAITTLEGMPRAVREVARHDGLGAGCAASAAAGVDRRAGAALRLLPERNDDPGRRPAGDDEAADRGADPHRDERPSVPLRHLSADPDGDPEGRCRDGEGWEVTMTEMLNKEFSRKSFVKGGGALIVGFSLAGAGAAGKAQARDSPYASNGPYDHEPVDSWLTIHADNTVVAQDEPDRARPGHHDRPADDRGRGAGHGDEPDAATSIGDTNVTPNRARTGGSNAIQYGAGPPRARGRGGGEQALLGLAATQLGVPVGEPDGREGRRLGRRQDRHLRRSCIGGKLFNVEMPASYNCAVGDLTAHRLASGSRRRSRSASTSSSGRASPRIDIPAKVTGTYTYVQNIRVPGMLHGRVVRPRGQGAVRHGRADRLGRRELDQAHPGRAGRAQGRLPRRRRAAGVRRDPGGRAAEGEVGRAPDAAGHRQPLEADAGARRAGKAPARVHARTRATSTTALASAAKTVSQTLHVRLQRPRADRPARARRRRDAGRARRSTRARRTCYGDRARRSRPSLGIAAVEQVRVDLLRGRELVRLGASTYDVAAGAALMSQLVGKPVRVQLMRWDEHGWDNYGPAQLIDVRGGDRRERQARRATSTPLLAQPVRRRRPRRDAAELTGTPYPHRPRARRAARRRPERRRRCTTSRTSGSSARRSRCTRATSSTARCAIRRRPADGVRGRADDRRARLRGEDGPGRVPAAEHHPATTEARAG